MEKVVKKSIEELASEGTIDVDTEEIGVDMRLLGSGSSIDSLDLVHIIVLIEEKVNNEFGVSITIANDDAMSRAKSPFINVETLARYTEELVNEKSNG